MIAAKLIASAALAASVLTPYRAAPAAAISPTAFDELFGVDATSPQNAWAVGLYISAPPGFHAHALTEHWNGRAWTRVAAPAPAGQTDIQLNGVAATSSSNAWAVGFFDTSGGLARTVIEHWNGRAWKIQPSPNPGSHSDFLQSVTALSATDAWAVGDYSTSETTEFTLFEHWNGRTWTRVPSPNLGGRNSAGLTGVAALTPASIWAVGSTISQLGIGTLAERWNGRAWKPVASPNPAGPANFNEPTGVAATSATNAWMAGMLTSSSTGARVVFVEHWNGRSWRQVASPIPAGAISSNLHAVTATSSASAWAVGYYFKGTQTLTLIEHWNGTAWKQVASANV